MRLVQFLSVAVVLAAIGCANKPTMDEELAQALASRSASKPQKRLRPPPIPNTATLLAVLAGQGAGPIRIGAAVGQVERLMQAR